MSDEIKKISPTQDREYEAGSIEEAIKKAYNDIPMPKEKIKIQILTEGKKGLFGKRGSKMAKIRASIVLDESLPK